MYNFAVAPPGDSIFQSPGYKKTQGIKTTPNNTSQKSASQPRSRNQSSCGIYRLAKHGKIQVICGPMFSGKSTELLRQMRVFEVAHHRSLLIKYSKDNRYSEKPVVSTHDKVMRKAVSSGKKLTLLNKIAVKFSVIGIDEGQFFEDIVEFAEEMANRGKTVIVAALDGTWEQKPFPNIANLMPKCESIVKLTSVCMACLKPGTFTRRLDANDTRLEVIGDTYMYAACCRRCLMLDSDCFREELQRRKEFKDSESQEDLYKIANEMLCEIDENRESPFKNELDKIDGVLVPVPRTDNVVADGNNAEKVADNGGNVAKIDENVENDADEEETFDCMIVDDDIDPEDSASQSKNKLSL